MVWMKNKLQCKTIDSDVIIGVCNNTYSFSSLASNLIDVISVFKLNARLIDRFECHLAKYSMK